MSIQFVNLARIAHKTMILLLLVSLLVAVSAAPAPSEDSTTVFGSSFLKIIPTKDLRYRDPIYWRPAVFFVGKENGDILRCLQENPNECEMFHQTGSIVFSLQIIGEYIYAGLASREIYRCKLYEKWSCRSIYKSDKFIRSMAVAGEYFYIGSSNNIMRCALNDISACHLYQQLESPIGSLLSSAEHMYSGTRLVQRCSLRTINSCSATQTADMATWIKGMGFVNFGNSIMAVSYTGDMYNCSLSGHCVKIRMLGLGRITDMKSHHGIPYVVDVDNGIYICNETECSNYANRNESVSIAFAYGTFDLQSRYIGENAACTWQNTQNCPPFVTYYDPQERSTLEVHVKDGKLRNSAGNLVDTSLASGGYSGRAAIFAMGPDGKLLLSNVHVPQSIHTSSLFAGHPVAGAGEMVVENGVIKKMTTCSAHYRPNLILNKQVIESLRSQGYTAPINSQLCDYYCQSNALYLVASAFIDNVRTAARHFD